MIRVHTLAAKPSNARLARAVRDTKLRAAIARLWRTLKRDLFESYRPELHYMRGPGPRWIEKHGRRR